MANLNLINEKLWNAYCDQAPKTIIVMKDGSRHETAQLTNEQIRECYGDVTLKLFDYLCETADEEGKADFMLSPWFEQYLNFDLDDLIDRLEDNGYKVKTRDRSSWIKNRTVDYSIFPDGKIVKAKETVLVEQFEIIVKA